MGEGSSENVAPPANTESESNQMMMDLSEAPALNKQPVFTEGVREDSLGGGIAAGAIAGAPVAVLTDSNHMMTD